MDKAPAVSSAAVVSAYHMAVKGTANDVVKRWVSEAQSAVSSDNVMVQYHALGLLYHIRYYINSVLLLVPSPTIHKGLNL